MCDKSGAGGGKDTHIYTLVVFNTTSYPQKSYLISQNPIQILQI
uniref:Uncharacterized protein n=1 Tax=Anguilla anguilla TaxID=7936 RepID=A0A0E9WSV1_ANGAN